MGWISSFSVRFLLVLFGLTFSLNSFSNTLVGSTPGSHGVSPDGSASYSIPIGVLPGTAGLSPKLSIDYVSGGGNGILGLGFQLNGLSTIQRCGTTIVQDGAFGGVDLDAADPYCIDGARLVEIGTSSECTNGREFRTEINSFNKVLGCGTTGTGPANFKVWTKSGEIMEYGNTTDSKLQLGTNALIYALNKLSDTAGNYLTVSYNKNDTIHHLVPNRIEYTSNDAQSLTGNQYIEFEYITRQDVIAQQVATYVLSTDQRATKITIGEGTTERKNYQFTYNDRGTSPALLTDVTECYFDSAQVEQCLPATSFDWATTSGGLTFGGVQTWATSGRIRDRNVLGDVDGDGLADWIYPEVLTSPGNARIFMRKSTGSGFGSETVAGSYYSYCTCTRNNVPFTTGCQAYACKTPQLDLFDVNGDGKSDLLLNNTIRLSNGTNFGSPVNIQPYSYGIGSYFDTGDMNGDGKDDYIYVVGGNNKNIYWRKSNGSNFAAPQILGSIFEYPNYYGFKLSMGDLDGDGRKDIITNNEVTTVNNLQYARRSKGSLIYPSQPFYGDSVTYGKVHINDLNGDGRDDWTYLKTGYPPTIGDPNPYTCNSSNICSWTPVYVTQTANISIREGAGASFINPQAIGSYTAKLYCNEVIYSEGPFGSQEFNGFACPTASGDTADVNGDGMADIVVFDDNAAMGARVRLAQVPGPDLITKVTDGLGAEVSFTYATLDDTSVYTPGTGATYPVRDLRNTLEVTVLKQVSADNGVGGQTTTTYHYDTGKIHHKGYGHLGFAKVTETDNDTGFKTITTYRQDYPYIGDPSRVEIRTATNALLAETDITYGLQGTIGSGPIFPYASSQVEKSYDLNNATLISTVTTATTYDSYGNTETVDVTTVDATGTYITETTNTYDNSQTNIDNWHLGRLTQTSVSKKINSGTPIVRTSTFEYDSTTGFLTKEKVEPGSAFELVKTYTHDGFGNQISVTTSGNGITSRTSETTFDSSGRFRISSENALTHAESYQTNDPWGGVTQLTGPNLLATSWTYDDMGRQVTETRADNSVTTVSYAWCDVSCPSLTNTNVELSYKVTTTATNEPDSTIYYDILGRAVLQETQSFNGSPVYVETEFNARGETYRVSHPYFTSPQYWTNYSYDDLGRVLQENSPATGVTTSAYNGLLTTITNAKSQVTKEYKNTLGWTLWTEDDNQNQVVFTYDPRGNLLTTTDPNSNVKTNQYNLLDQKISMSDPDMGTWTYSYNVLGELVSQTDAKSQTVTMQYDVLGRMISRTEPEGTTTWTYDSGSNAKGKIVSESHYGGFSRTYVYDGTGRLRYDRPTINGITHEVRYYYIQGYKIGRIKYPTGITYRYQYNSYGYLDMVKRHSDGFLYWRADAADEFGNITTSTLGNGVISMKDYEDNSGRLSNIITNAGLIQNLNYTYDSLGNLTQRNDAIQSLTEDFGYDNLNRLTTIGGVTKYSYDSLGNLLTKDGVSGTYQYNSARPHAVTDVGTINYQYDANGNMTSGDGRNITWSSFNKPTNITKGSASASFQYGPDRARYQQTSTNGSTSSTITYVGDLFEIEQTGALQINRSYIKANGETIAIVTDRNNGIGDTRYLHRDHLGSIDTITDENGNIVEKHSFDAFGHARLTNWSGLTAFSSAVLRRGFTGHEMLEDVGLIHMNGRVYDPTIGRFLSADPHIQSPLNLQSHNRYSYVMNNPLSYTDPSGFFFKSLFKKIARAVSKLVKKITRAVSAFLKKYGRSIAAIAITAYAPYAGWNSFAAGFGAGLVASGGDIKAGIVSGFSAGVLSGTVHNLSGLNKLAAHAAVGGVSSAAQGGDFFSGAIAGGVTQFASQNFEGAFYNNPAGLTLGQRFHNVTVAAAIGGTASAISGGKFANGAVTGAFSRAFNDDVITGIPDYYDGVSETVTTSKLLEENLLTIPIGGVIPQNYRLSLGANLPDPYSPRGGLPVGIDVVVDFNTLQAEIEIFKVFDVTTTTETWTRYYTARSSLSGEIIKFDVPKMNVSSITTEVGTYWRADGHIGGKVGTMSLPLIPVAPSR